MVQVLNSAKSDILQLLNSTLKPRPKTVLYGYDNLHDVISAKSTLHFPHLEIKAVFVFVSKMIKVTLFWLKLSFTIN